MLKMLVIYDSLFGNTKLIADAIAHNFPKKYHVELQIVTKMRLKDLVDIDVLIVGSPTHGGQPTPKMEHFLKSIHPEALKNVRVATFDTRLWEAHQVLPVQWLMKIIGYAAPKMTDLLKTKGGEPISDPMGFISTEKRGPLAKGELERAAVWAASLLEND